MKILEVEELVLKNTDTFIAIVQPVSKSTAALIAFLNRTSAGFSGGVSSGLPESS